MNLRKKQVLYLCIFILFDFSSIGLAEDIGELFMPNGQPVSGVRSHIEKANQSQAVWFDSTWWGGFRSTAGEEIWHIYKMHKDTLNNTSWTRETELGISSEDQVDMHVDPFNAKLYVLFSVHEKVYRLSYVNDNWEVDDGFPKNLSIGAGSNDPACITRANDGDLFVFSSTGGSLRVNYSSNNGDSWSNFSLGSASSALVDAIPFYYGSGWNVGVFIGEGGGSLDYTFLRLSDSLNASSSSSWIEEALPFDDYPELKADDHVNIIKDAEHNLYTICKLGDGGPTFFIMKRDVLGDWSIFEAESDGGTRPAIAFDNSNKRLYAFARTEGKIQYVSQHRDSLMNVANSDWQPVLSNGTNAFNNVSAPYQIFNSISDLLVLGENESLNEIWYNILEIRDSSFPQYPLTIQTSGPGSVSANPPGGVYDSATVVALTAIPAPGYMLDSWSGDLSGNANPKPILMNAPKSVTAIFVESPLPDITLSPSGHDFGEIALGDSSSASFTIGNDGDWDLAVDSVVVNGSDKGLFFIEGVDGGLSLSSGETRNFSVKFLPDNTGPASALLRVYSNDPDVNPLDASLAGSAAPPPPPTIAADPDSFDYGFVVLGTSALKIVEIRNDGGPGLQIDTLMLTGGDSLDFQIVNGAGPFELNSGEIHQLVVGFAPAALDTKRTTLRIESNDTLRTPLDIHLSGLSVESLSEITLAQIVSGGGSGVVSITTEEPLDGVSGNLYLASVASKSFVDVDTINGLGLDWSPVRKQCAARSQTGVEVWMALGAATTSEPVTAILAGSPGNAVLTVARYSGADTTNPIGNIISGNTLGENGLCSGGSDNAAYTFNIDASTGGSLIYGATAMRNKSHEPGENYREQIERMQGSGGGAAGGAVVDSTIATAGTVPFLGSFSSSVDWAVIALEIKPGIGSSDAPNIVVTPTLLEYGEVPIGNSVPLSITVTNDSTADLNVSSTELMGSWPQFYQIDSGAAPFTVAPGDTHMMTISFNPVEAGGREAFLQMMSNDEDTNPVNVALIGIGIAPGPVFTKSIAAGWNLLALPNAPLDPHYLSVFPNASPNTLFHYSGGYIAEDSLENGDGYWLLFDAAEAAPIAGFDTTNIVIDLVAGWNLIGGISYDIAVTDIDDPLGLIIPGTLFGYANGYFTTDSVLAGNGYWINSNGEGQITLDTILSKNNELSKEWNSLPDISQAPMLTIQDAGKSGQPQMLRFNAKIDSASAISYQLPPLSPTGKLDARFENNASVISHDESDIQIRTHHYPVTIEANDLPIAGNCEYVISEVLGGEVIVHHILKTGMPIIIQNPHIRTLRLTKSTHEIPTEFSLRQNYPNPFNPETIVRYHLPQPELVRLTIYNQIGQKVMELVNQRQPAGVYQMKWNGKDRHGFQVASGVYLYRIQAGGFSETRKMILLR